MMMYSVVLIAAFMCEPHRYADTPYTDIKGCSSITEARSIPADGQCVPVEPLTGSTYCMAFSPQAGCRNAKQIQPAPARSSCPVRDSKYFCHCHSRIWH